MKIDRRKTYLIGLDTETCNSYEKDGKLVLDDSLVYDIGWQVIDKKGKVYRKRSFLIYEIFCGERDLMQSAYYAKKIPQYWEEVKSGKRKIITFRNMRKIFQQDIKDFKIKIFFAHNARFDLNALNKTQRLLTGSKYRYFFPYNSEIWDTLKMSRDIIVKTKGYQNFCEKNNYMTKHKTPRPRATAEILYKYISGNYDFVESHTGLEDVEIETEILIHCLKAHRKMQKSLF